MVRSVQVIRVRRAARSVHDGQTMRPADYSIRIALALSAAMIPSVAHAQAKPQRADIGEPVKSTMWVLAASTT